MAEILTPEEQEEMREGMKEMMARREKVRKALGPEEAAAFERKVRVRMRQFMEMQRREFRRQQQTVEPGAAQSPQGPTETGSTP